MVEGAASGMTASLDAAVALVRDRMARSAARVGRAADEVQLVAVTKTHPTERVRAAFAVGLRDFGENRIQEAAPKIAALEDLRAGGARWHLVGHLQSNKARKAVELFDVVHSLDDLDLARRLDRTAGERGTRLSVLVQVGLAGEATKSGLPASDLFATLDGARSLPHLSVDGLMLLPPYFDDPERARPFFARLRELRDAALERGLLAGTALSMGMSHDFEVAIEEGATMIRVGTALFGERR
jgi:pyridoxal phosphate enzyme (YggS family)